MRLTGFSVALDPDAQVLAQAGSEGEAILSAEIGAPGRRDARVRYLELLRAELYDRAG